jgi:hypothetical protein
MEALMKLGTAGVTLDKDVKRQKVYKINFSENHTYSSINFCLDRGKLLRLSG